MLRRSRRTRGSGRSTGAPRAAVVAVAIVLGSRGGFIGAVVGLVVGLAAVVAAHRALAGVAVEVHDDGLVHRRVLSTRRWAWSEVGSVLHATRVSTTAHPEATWVVPRDRRGRRLLQLTSTAWPPEALTTLVERVGAHAPVLDERGPVPLRTLAGRHRGAFSLAQRRPAVFSVLVTVVGLAAVLGASTLAHELLGRS